MTKHQGLDSRGVVLNLQVRQEASGDALLWCNGPQVITDVWLKNVWLARYSRGQLRSMENYRTEVPKSTAAM